MVGLRAQGVSLLFPFAVCYGYSVHTLCVHTISTSVDISGQLHVVIVICHHSHSGNKTCARNEPNCFGKFKIELSMVLKYLFQ